MIMTEETAADRVATFVKAFMANPYRHGHPAILTIAGEATNHKDLSLDAHDVAELVGPNALLLHEVIAALAALPDDEDAKPDYSGAEAVADAMTPDALSNLAVALNEARLLVMNAHRSKARALNLNEMYAKQGDLRQSDFTRRA